jgi:ribosome-associated protein
MLTEAAAEAIIKECLFRTSRSGGKGGQNVNKVETRVELIFQVTDSKLLTDVQKERIISKAGPDIRVASEKHRTQSANRYEAGEKLILKLNQLLKKEKPRRPTKPTKASKRRKKESKTRHSEKKSMRGRLDI